METRVLFWDQGKEEMVFDLVADFGTGAKFSRWEFADTSTDTQTTTRKGVGIGWTVGYQGYCKWTRLVCRRSFTSILGTGEDRV